jgi:1-acyl-sn-glycerol-3-phosphate acyltransferase
MAAVRALLFNLCFFGLTFLVCLAYLPLMLLPWRVLSGAVRLWAVMVMWLLRVVVGIRHQVRGAEKLPQRPAIIAAKHQSAWETIAFNALLRDPAFVFKSELLLIPVWGWLAWRTGQIRVDRRAGAKALKRMAAAARTAIADRRSIVIFPQGTRTPPGQAGPYLPGVAALYQALQVPVVPVALNSGRFWGRRAFLKRPGVITIEYLDPIPPGLDRKAFMRQLEHRIETATRRLEAEAEQQQPIIRPCANRT